MPARGTATVLMPGTCGELVQGMANGSHFLISAPVNIYSRVTVELTAAPHVEAPPDTPKAAMGLRATLAHFGLAGAGARLTIDSPLPRGKGMGSSTADLAGTIYATAWALGEQIPPNAVAKICLAIEPTDGSLFSGVVAFDHRRGSFVEELGSAPPLDVLVLDVGGEIDTIIYNAVDRDCTLSRLSPSAEQALELAREGLRCGDLRLLGQAATLSARAHQEVLPKAALESIISAGHVLGALGVNVGHSGTVVGVLFPAGRATRGVASAMAEIVPEVRCLGVCSLVDGGPRQVDAASKKSGEPRPGAAQPV